MKNENKKESYSYKGWLISDNFVKRLVAVTLYQMLGSFIISFVLLFVIMIFLVVVSSLFGAKSISNNYSHLNNQPERQNISQENNIIDSKQGLTNTQSKEDLLIGSWVDTSDAGLNFTLNADGSAQSDGMATLVYKSWRRIGDNKVGFVVESVGNGTSSTEEEVYNIVKLTDKEMILKDGDYTMKYIKKQK